MAEIETMDMNSFLESFETVFRYVFDYFSIPSDRKSMNMREEDFLSFCIYEVCGYCNGFILWKLNV